jgi:D-3-phosphoglycerate dehydrogenase
MGSAKKKKTQVDCIYGLSEEELCDRIAGYDALIVRSGTKVSRKVLEASRGRLKVVGRAGVGIDNVDLAAATELGCLVVNAPTANTIAAAEHGIALLAAMARNIPQASASLKSGPCRSPSLRLLSHRSIDRSFD